MLGCTMKALELEEGTETALVPVSAVVIIMLQYGVKTQSFGILVIEPPFYLGRLDI